MSKEEQYQLVVAIMKSFEDELTDLIRKIPPEWDGFEIKQWINDYYTMNYLDKNKLKGKRLKDYKNTILVNNLT